jgi:hypothetical protein
MSSKRCFIIGGGPSINSVNLDLIKDEYVIGVNEAVRLGTWIDLWFFADSDIYKAHRNDIGKWPNRIVTCAGAAKWDKRVEYYYRCRNHVICYEKKHLAFPQEGANSGATALTLAIREGFETIVLLGFDMKTTNGVHHYHSYYSRMPRDDAYDRFRKHFEDIAKETTCNIINANPDSALDCFPKMKLEDIL